ncbi:uncharacterized protein [Ptychodera flava]|uniref:uncharacterized protein n=1 Tax=Ptychodera flava TaxID=63121 RepID=UPI003969D424
MSDSGVTRVVLWCHPGSRSTAFELAIASDKSIQIIHEPFARAYFAGEERLCHEKYIRGPPLPGYRYKDIRVILEKSYPDKSAVFVKDGAYALGGRAHYKYIPHGYIHTFIVRNPKAAVLSAFRTAKKMFPTENNRDILVDACIDVCNMVPFFELYKYVTEELHQRPIVIDSQDLVNSPREIITKYCEATGLLFRESFLNWEPGNTEIFPEHTKTPAFKHVFGKAVDSSCFVHSFDSDIDVTELPEKLKQCIREYMPIYEEMASRKL